MKTNLLFLRASTCSLFTAITTVFFAASVFAEDINHPVPNGDFESAGNDGTIGGVFPGIIGSGSTASPLSAGPWGARSTGLLNLLLAPQVTIASAGAANGTCRISGLAGVNILGGFLRNRASVSQTLSVQVEPWEVYTLEADVDCASLLSAGVLSQNGVGIALTAGGTTVATSINGTAPHLSVESLAGTSYRVRLRFETGDTPPAGALGIRLFAGEGAALLHAGLLPTVTFDNVRLTISRLEA